MANIEKVIYNLHRYGQFFNPYYNYLLENTTKKDIEIYLKISILKEKGLYEEVIKEIKKGISKVKNCNVYYLLMAMKMSAEFTLKLEDYKTTYKILKKNIRKIPPLAREILKPVFLSIEGNNLHFKKSRFWGKSTFKDNYYKAYYLLGSAYQQKNIKKKRVLLSKSLLISREIPNPSLMKAALYNLELTYTNESWGKKYINILNTYYTSYYFSKISKSLAPLITYIKYLKKTDINHFFIELCMLKRIIDKTPSNELLNNKSYREITEKAIELDLEICSYNITEEIYNIIKNISKTQNINKFAKNHSLSRTTIYSLLKKEKNKLNSKTIRKVVANLENLDEDLPFIFHIEKFKVYIDKQIEVLYHQLKITKEKDFILNVFSTYMAYIKFHKTKNKKLKILMKLKKMSLNQLLSHEYKYKYFLIQLLQDNTSVFLKARKDLIKSNLEKLDYNFLKRLFHSYISKPKEDREILDNLMLNFKRFEKIDLIKDINYDLSKPNPVSKQNIINSLYSLEKEQRDRAYELILESNQIKRKSY
ncbi:MAG: hypothetical protein ACQESN_12010 [Thermotogota bacterium]